MDIIEIVLIVVLGVVAIALIVLSTVLLLRKKKSKTVSQPIPDNEELAKNIIKAVGGKDNIVAVAGKMTRLAVEVKTSSSFDPNVLPDIKALVMEKKITLIIGSKAEKIGAAIQSLIE